MQKYKKKRTQPNFFMNFSFFKKKNRTFAPETYNLN